MTGTDWTSDDADAPQTDAEFAEAANQWAALRSAIRGEQASQVGVITRPAPDDDERL